ncbi:MAG TPA: NYN domain-containing protein [Candidatus Paceibacterota bacterium]|nr:NYN domain-containing protein [Candidatus Paceibacterota bacterium]
MLISNKYQRVLVLIDAQNLYHSAKNLYKARINFANLLKEIVKDRQLVRAIAYVVKSDEPGESLFFDALTNAGIEMRMKDLQVYPDGTKKADWDVGLAVDAIRYSNLMDVIVLATGDGDFIPLIEYLRQQGRNIVVANFGRTTSSKFKELADEFIDLDKTPGKFLMFSNKMRPSFRFKREGTK